MLHSFRETGPFLSFLRSLRLEAFFERFGLGPDGLELGEGQLGFIAESDGELTGLFRFNFYESDVLLEKSRWFSDSEAACREMLDHLKAHYPSFRVEFTCKEPERMLPPLLTEYGARVFSEQQNMERDASPSDLGDEGVEPLSEAYREQYFALHRENSDGAYWTGEMVAADPETFRVFLAVEDGDAVGYLDLARWEKANNVSDLYVRERYRRSGYGARLLAKAAEVSAPKRLTLQVDVENTPALRLYEKLGFRRIEGANTVDAIWQL